MNELAVLLSGVIVVLLVVLLGLSIYGRVLDSKLRIARSKNQDLIVETLTVLRKDVDLLISKREKQ